MKKRVFLADAKGVVETLGVALDCKPEDIHILINGSDISELLTLERIEIIIDTETKTKILEVAVPATEEGKE